MKIGKLRHRVRLQEYVISKDSFGAEVENWSDTATVWASIEPLSGREYFAAQQINAEVSTKITIRYRAGVKPTMRILFGGRIFEILSVINTEEKNRELILMCREVLEDGAV
jgi:SPP1 family predicted phage head-tail adaptor